MGEMMAAADTNKDGMVDLAEFKASTLRIGHAVLAANSLHRLRAMAWAAYHSSGAGTSST